MKKRKKINKLKITIAICALVIFFMSVTGLGRFVYNSINDRYLSSKKFYFTSDLLTQSGSTYAFANWDGQGVYEITIELFSQNNDLEQYEDDLKYNLAISYNDAYIQCAVDDPTAFPETTEGNQKTYDFEERTILANTHNDKIKLYVRAATGEDGENKELELGRNHEITVKAYTTEPYRKSLSATFSFEINEIAYKIEDHEGRSYVTLNVRNVSSAESNITINFDSEIVRLDMNDMVFVEDTSTTTTVDGETIVNGITFPMKSETSRDIKFYKTSDDNPLITTGDVTGIFEINKD